MPPVADVVERRDGIVGTSHRLAVDSARAEAQTGERFDDQWKAA
jgi:hypothetical protein